MKTIKFEKPKTHGATSFPEALSTGLLRAVLNDPLVFGMIKAGYGMEDVIVAMFDRNKIQTDVATDIAMIARPNAVMLCAECPHKVAIRSPQEETRGS